MSPELHAARCGNITASRISDVMMEPSKAGYQNYMAELISERMTGVQRDGFCSKEMLRGQELEPIARAHYEAENGLFVVDGGYAPHPTIKRAGASPDGLVGNDGLIEIKCRNAANHIATILTKRIAREQQFQMQWQMACTGRAWCDSISFHPDMPPHLQLCVIRVEPDYKLIAQITERVKALDEEIEQKIKLLTEVRL
jgi:hypothetical protein